MGGRLYAGLGTLLACGAAAITWTGLPESFAIVGILGLAAGRPRQDGALLMRSHVRQRILCLMHEHNAMTRPQLCKALGISYTAATHHLRVLLASGILQESAAGAPNLRNRTYMLNGGSAPLQPGQASSISGAGVLAAIESHPLRRAVVEILDGGPTDYDGLCAGLNARGFSSLPQTTISYHLGLLRRNEVVQSRWVGRRKVYSIKLSVHDIRAQQIRAFAGKMQLWPLVKRLAHAPATASQLSAEGWKPAQGAKALIGLVELGFAWEDNGVFRLKPQLVAIASSSPEGWGGSRAVNHIVIPTAPVQVA